MSGFGIREVFEAGQELDGIRLWREESFLQQLSLNGSLLWAENSDEAYQRLLASRLYLTPGVDWEFMRSVLKILPAWAARRALWRASRDWLATVEYGRLLVLREALLVGRVEEIGGYYGMRALDDRLQLRHWQLDVLKWCDADSQEDQIEIIERPSGRIRPERPGDGKAEKKPAKRARS